MHGVLSRGTMPTINADEWSSNKHVTHHTRSEVNVISFAESGRAYLRGAFLNAKEDFLINNLNTLLLNQIMNFA